MSSVPDLPDLLLGPWWRTQWTGGGRIRLHYGAGEDDADESGGEAVAVRAAAGWLRDAYPVGLHDIEFHIVQSGPSALAVRALDEFRRAAFCGDQQCRRIVVSVEEKNRAGITAAETIGLRYVGDVDVPNAALSLFVFEPDWVTYADANSRVPDA